jgi:ribosomal protein L37AE/L43A
MTKHPQTTTKKQQYNCWTCQTELQVAVYKQYIEVQPCRKCMDEAKKPAYLIQEALEMISPKPVLRYE